MKNTLLIENGCLTAGMGLNYFLLLQPPSHQGHHGHDADYPQQYVCQGDAEVLPPCELCRHLLDDGVRLGDRVVHGLIQRVVHLLFNILGVPSVNAHGVALLGYHDAVVHVDTVALKVCLNQRVGVVFDDGDVLHALAR